MRNSYIIKIDLSHPYLENYNDKINSMNDTWNDEFLFINRFNIDLKF